MSQTTGPVLGAAGVVITNRVIFNSQPMDWRVPIAAGFVALGMGMFERVAPGPARIVAWTMVVTALSVRTDPSIPTPIESAERWWRKT